MNKRRLSAPLTLLLTVQSMTTPVYAQDFDPAFQSESEYFIETQKNENNENLVNYSFDSISGTLTIHNGTFKKERSTPWPWESQPNPIQKAAIKTIEADPKGKFFVTGNLEDGFYGYSNLEHADLSNWDVTEITGMRSLFKDCKKLETLNLNHWNPKNTTTMSIMFMGCEKLQTLDLPGWQADEVTDLYGMFMECYSLSSLNMQGWTVPKLEKTFYMFVDCNKLNSLNMGGWKTESLSSMSRTFVNCYNLEAIDLSGWDVQKVTNMGRLFQDCSNLKFIDLSGWKTQDSIRTFDTFKKCGNLTSVLASKHCTSLLAELPWTEVWSDSQNKAISKEEWLETLPDQDQISSIPPKQNQKLLSPDTVQISIEPSQDSSSPNIEVTYKGQTLQPEVDYRLFYLSSDDPSILRRAIYGTGEYAGTVLYLQKQDNPQPDPAPTPDPGPTPIPSPSPSTPAVKSELLYRLYNPNSGEHFYTSRLAESHALIALGWQDEGIGWKAPKSSNTPVYRLYNPNQGDHHYTTSSYERDVLVSKGWKNEGIGWYSDDAKAIPLYRSYNPNQFAANHNYTTKQAEHSSLLSLGWQDEGIGWYGMK